MNVRYKITLIISLFIALLTAPHLSAEKINYNTDPDADRIVNSFQRYEKVFIAQVERMLKTPDIKRAQEIQKIPPDQLKRIQPKTDETGTVSLYVRSVSSPPLYVGEPVSFEAETEPHYPNLQYKFDFGDGVQSELSSSSKVTHVYKKAGSYTVQIAAAASLMTGAARLSSQTVLRGKPITITILNPSQPIELHLKSDKNKSAPGEQVRFQAIVEPSVKNIRYQYSFGDGSSSKWTGRTESDHRYEKEGTYYATVEAVAENQRLKSNRVKVTVRRSVPEPRARIYPEHVVVTRGERATFESHSEIYTEKGDREYWRGPGGQKGRGKSFTVDTADLAPGEHRIRLDVTDALKQSDRAAATLEVIKQIKYQVELEADPRGIMQGDRVRLRAHIVPGVKRAEYHYDYGDGSKSGWTDRALSDHRYEKEGTYYASVEAVAQNQRLKSNRVKITVERREPEPRARIYPEHVAVKRGERATFESHSEIYTEEGGREYWKGPGGQEGREKSFSIDTAYLAPREYKIILDVYDSMKRRNRATAILEVKAPVEYQVNIEADPQRIKQGERVRFGAHIVPGIDGVEFRYDFGDGSESGWIDRDVNEHVYNEKGMYHVLAEVRIKGRTFRSERIRIVVEGRDGPVARIDPAYAEIERGGRAVFVSTSTGDEITRESWEGPGDTAAQGRRFEVATNNLEPGIYKVHLEVEDRWRQRTMVTATLEIVEASPPGDPYVLILEPDRDRTEPRQPVLFVADLRPFTDGVEYKFYFGDGQSQEWGGINRAEHIYSEPGIYHARVTARVQGRETFEINSSRVALRVAGATEPPERDPWKWAALGAGALIFGGGAY
jgi:PKD repeat protein